MGGDQSGPGKTLEHLGQKLLGTFHRVRQVGAAGARSGAAAAR
jgi:hypothetical protein